MLMTLIILIGLGIAAKELLPLLRKRQFRDAAVCGLLAAAGIFCSAAAGAGVEWPSPLSLLVVLYGPLVNWMNWIL